MENKLIIFEPWEADIPGPEMSSGETVVDCITRQLDEKNIHPFDVTFITPNLDCRFVAFAGKVLHYPYHFVLQEALFLYNPKYRRWYYY